MNTTKKSARYYGESEADIQAFRENLKKLNKERVQKYNSLLQSSPETEKEREQQIAMIKQMHKERMTILNEA